MLQNVQLIRKGPKKIHYVFFWGGHGYDSCRPTNSPLFFSECRDHKPYSNGDGYADSYNTAPPPARGDSDPYRSPGDPLRTHICVFSALIFLPGIVTTNWKVARSQLFTFCPEIHPRSWVDVLSAIA